MSEIRGLDSQNVLDNAAEPETACHMPDGELGLVQSQDGRWALWAMMSGLNWLASVLGAGEAPWDLGPASDYL